MQPCIAAQYRLVGVVGAFLAVAVAVSPSPAADLVAANLVAQGNIEYRQLRFDTALARYDLAIRQDTSYAVAHNNRGLALHKLGRLDEATAALTTALRLDSSKAGVYLNLGKVHATAGRYADALSAFDRALQLNPAMAAALYNRIWVLEQQTQIAKAAAECGRLAAVKGQPPGANLLIGIVQAQHGEAAPLAEATCTPADLPQQWRWLAEANRSLGTGGAADMHDSARKVLQKGLLAASTEQFTEARKQFAVVARAAPKHPVPLWLSAMVLVAGGDQQNAEAAMKRAAPLMPTFAIPARTNPTVLVIDGTLIGRSPAKASLLPGVHLVDVVARNGEKYAVFNHCGRFRPGVVYTLPAVKFEPMPAPGQLALPPDLRSAIQKELAF